VFVKSVFAIECQQPIFIYQMYPIHKNNQKYLFDRHRILNTCYKDAIQAMCGLSHEAESNSFIVNNYDLREVSCIGEIYDDNKKTIFNYLIKNTDFESQALNAKGNIKGLLHDLNLIILNEPDYELLFANLDRHIVNFSVRHKKMSNTLEL